MAAVVSYPHDTRVTCLPCSPVTMVGVKVAVKPSNPNWPLSLDPHAYTTPLSVNATVWANPAHTYTMRVLSRECTLVGSVKSTDTLRKPSCPNALLPQV